MKKKDNQFNKKKRIYILDFYFINNINSYYKYRFIIYILLKT